MGDVKLAGVLGLYLGRAVAPAMLIALIVGVVVGARRSSPARARRRGPQDRRAVRAVPRARRHGRLLRRQRARRRLPRHASDAAAAGRAWTHVGRPRAQVRVPVPMRRGSPAPQPPAPFSMAQAHQAPSSDSTSTPPASPPRQVAVNGPSRASSTPPSPALEPGIMRDGEVADVDGLAEALRALCRADTRGSASACASAWPTRRSSSASSTCRTLERRQGARRGRALPGAGAACRCRSTRGPRLPAARGRHRRRPGAAPARRRSSPPAATWSSASWRPPAPPACSPRASTCPPSPWSARCSRQPAPRSRRARPLPVHRRAHQPRRRPGHACLFTRATAAASRRSSPSWPSAGA